MRVRETKTGEYYSFKLDSNPDSTWITQLTPSKNQCDNIMIGKGNNYYEKSGDFTDNDGTFTIATPEEKAWLQACQKMRHMTAKPEITKQLPIFN